MASLLERADDPALSASIPTWHSRLLTDIIAKAKRRRCAGIEISRLEQEASGPLLTQLVNRATDMGLLMLSQRTLFHPAAVADVVTAILRSGKLVLSRAELCTTLGWTLFPASSYRGAGSLLALLSQAGVLIPAFLARFIIPANAPELPVPTLRSTYRRVYKLPYVLGIGRRLQARLAHFSGAQLGQQAVLITREDVLLATIRLSDTRWVIDAVQDRALFLQLLDCVEAMLAEYTIRVEQVSVPRITPEWVFVGLGLPTTTLPLQVAELGQGGGGAVYTAIQDGKLVAVKQFKDTPLTAVVREVGLSLAFKHPNLVMGLGAVASPPALLLELVPLRDLCHAFHFPNAELERRRSEVHLAMRELDKERAFVMANYATMADRLDFLNARSKELEHIQEQLRQACIINNLQITLTLRLQVLVDVAQALVVLHSAVPPILHNDVRSPNIFLVSLEPQAAVHAKLGDFGLAQRLYGSCRLRLQTWQWLAPEVLRGDDFGLASDIFGFGVVMWELLHGPGLATPYDSTLSGPQVKERIIYHSLRPAISPLIHQHFSSDPLYNPWLQLLADCWEKEPNNRPDSTAVLVRLQALIECQGKKEVHLFDYAPVAQIFVPTPNLLPTLELANKPYEPVPSPSDPLPLRDQPWWQEQPQNLDGQLPGTFYVRPDSFVVEYVDREGYQQQCSVLASPAGYQLRGGRQIFQTLAFLVSDLMERPAGTLFLERPFQGHEERVSDRLERFASREKPCL